MSHTLLGEYMKSYQSMREAADVLAGSPSSMQLRYLNTLQEIASDKTNTIVFPFSPEEIAKMIGKPNG